MGEGGMVLGCSGDGRGKKEGGVGLTGSNPGFNYLRDVGLCCVGPGV